MNDGVTGAVLPSIETQYNVTYSVVSLLFVTYALGFIASAPVISTIDAKIGRSRLLMLACSCMTAGYTILLGGNVKCQHKELSLILPSTPFPSYRSGLLHHWSGRCAFPGSIQCVDSESNERSRDTGLHAWSLWGEFRTESFPSHSFIVYPTLNLRLVQVGGVVSPLIATAMISKGIRWSYFYAIPLTLAAISVGSTGWSYRGFEADAAVQLMTALEQTASRRSMPGDPTKRQQLWKSFKNRTTVLGALFIFFYQGGEVAISGWVISYLIHVRDGDPSQVGNVTSGFWGGITRGLHLFQAVSNLRC